MSRQHRLWPRKSHGYIRQDGFKDFSPRLKPERVLYSKIVIKQKTGDAFLVKLWGEPTRAIIPSSSMRNEAKKLRNYLRRIAEFSRRINRN